MTAIVLSGKQVAAEIRAETVEIVNKLSNSELDHNWQW